MNILITGASRGIGYSTALEFSGMPIENLYLLSRNIDKLKTLKTECLAQGTKATIHLIPFDLEQIENESENLIKHIESSHLDIIVNNAGLLINKAFNEVSSKEALSILKVNFLAPATLLRVLFDKMGNTHSTHVINISSMGGVQGSSKYPGLSYYSASKGALAILTEALAAEYQDKNIRFNCLALGAVQTEMLNEAFPGYQAPLKTEQMAEFIADFAVNGGRFFNGKILPVALTNP